jgi:hypothetical protein
MSKGGLAGGSKMSNVLKASEDLLKTPEQLEEEKRHTIANRVPTLRLDNVGKEELAKKVRRIYDCVDLIHFSELIVIKKVQEFYSKLIEVTSYIYDLGERMQAQKYEVNLKSFKI